MSASLSRSKYLFNCLFTMSPYLLLSPPPSKRKTVYPLSVTCLPSLCPFNINWRLAPSSLKKWVTRMESDSLLFLTQEDNIVHNQKVEILRNMLGTELRQLEVCQIVQATTCLTEKQIKMEIFYPMKSCKPMKFDIHLLNWWFWSQVILVVCLTSAGFNIDHKCRYARYIMDYLLNKTSFTQSLCICRLSVIVISVWVVCLSPAAHSLAIW